MYEEGITVIVKIGLVKKSEALFQTETGLDNFCEFWRARVIRCSNMKQRKPVL